MLQQFAHHIVIIKILSTRTSQQLDLNTSLKKVNSKITWSSKWIDVLIRRVSISLDSSKSTSSNSTAKRPSSGGRGAPRSKSYPCKSSYDGSLSPLTSAIAQSPLLTLSIILMDQICSGLQSLSVLMGCLFQAAQNFWLQHYS